MALVSDGFTLNVSLIDTNARKFSRRYDLVAATHAQATTDTATILAALAAVTTCKINGYNITEKFAEDNKSYPADSNGHDQAIVVVNLNSLDKTANLMIPGAVDALFTKVEGVASNMVNPGALVLAPYVALFKKTGAFAQISDGEYIDDTVPVFSGRRNRKGE